MADNFQQVQLEPVARPTDQFAPREVRKPQPDNQLMELAGSLKDFSSAAGQIMDRRLSAYQQSSQLAADRDFAAANINGNIEGFRQAVKNGQIHEVDNPWYKVQASQDIARNEAKTAYEQTWNAYQNSPVKNSDDPREVAGFIDQQFAPYLKGKDAWEVQAIAPELQEYKSQIIQEHIQFRRQAIENSRVEALTSSAHQQMDKLTGDVYQGYVTGDPAATTQVNGVIANIQKRINAAALTMDGTKVNQLAIQTAIEAAKEHRNADLARIILDNLTTRDGGKLSKIDEARSALDVLPRQVADLQNADLRSDTENRELQATKGAQLLMEQAGKWQKEQGVSNLFDVKIPTDVISKTHPMAWDQYQRMVAAAAADWQAIKNTQYAEQLDPVAAQAFKDAASGKLTKPDTIKFGALMAIYGEPGRSALEQFQRTIKYQHDLAEGVTKPDALAKMNNLAQSGSLTTDDVLKEFENGTLDKHDTHTYLSIAAQVQAEQGRSVPLVHSSLDQITNLLASQLRTQGGALPGDQAALQNRTEQARSAFLDQYFNRLAKQPGWSDLPLSEQQKQAGELRDTVVHQADPVAPSYAEWLKDFKGATERPFEPKATPKPTTQPAAGVVTSGQQREQVASDPFAVALDKDVINSAKQALNFKPNVSLHEVMDAWNPQAYYAAVSTFLAPTVDLYHPPLPEDKQQEIEKPLDKLGLRDFTNLKELRTHQFERWGMSEPVHGDVVVKDWNPITGESTTVLKDAATPTRYQVLNKYSIANGTMPSGFVDDDSRSVEEREAELWKGGMAHLIALKPEAADAVQTIRTVSQQFGQTGKITPQQQADLRLSLIKVMAFQELREQIGYTPEEVKSAGAGAWRQMPMFANPLDLKTRGESVARMIGLQDFQFKAFRDSQMQLLKIIRETQANPQQQQQ